MIRINEFGRPWCNDCTKAELKELADADTVFASTCHWCLCLTNRLSPGNSSDRKAVLSKIEFCGERYKDDFFRLRLESFK